MPPQSPNYVPGVGRLTTDRYDFQKHLDGYGGPGAISNTGSRHTANQIDLSPPLVIDGYTSTTVQQALYTISLDLNPVIPVATTSVPGIVTLAGDLAGTYTVPIVKGLLGRSLQNIAPNVGQVLTWNGSSWAPINPIAGTNFYSVASIVTSPYTISYTSQTILYEVNAIPASAPAVINLPAANSVSAGRFYIFKDNTGRPAPSFVGDTHYIEITPNGSDTIDEANTSYTIYDGYGSAQFISDGYSNWQVIQSNKYSYALGQELIFSNSGALTISRGGLLSLDYSGTMAVNDAGALVVNAAGGIVLEAAEDFVQFGTAHTRNIYNTFSPLYFDSTYWAQYIATSPWAGTPCFRGLTNDGFALYIKLDNLHNGATLNTLSVTFAVHTTHSNVPAGLPNIGVYATKLGDLVSAVPVDLASVPQQSLSPTPGTGLAYYDSGSLQNIVFTANQNNVIDTSNYIYYVIIYDENGTNSLATPYNEYFGYTVNYTDITTDQFP